VGAVVIVVALIAGAFFVGSAAGGLSLFGSVGGEPYTEVGDTVVESVRSMARLTSVEMVEYTTIEKGTDHGWLNWANKDQIFMLAVARIGAGVDLQGLSPSAFDVDESGVVWVELPPAEVMYVALDNRATQVYDRDTGLFTEGNPQLESEARLAAEGILRQSALDHGILDVAQENAETAVRELLLALGYDDVRFVAPLAVGE
jgi:hypothetical protein